MEIKQYTKNISSHFEDFSEVIMSDSPVNILSIHVVGSALTPDFIPGQSDVNSIVVVNEITLEFLDFIVRLGKKYSQYGVAAPLLMTPGYIETSLDVFPVEFLNFSAIHHTMFGPDILRDLSIDSTHLLLQCEREVKSKLLWLHQGYIESLDDEKQLVVWLSNSITGYIPLFRAILFLDGHKLMLSAEDTAAALEKYIGLDTKIFKKIVQLKNPDTAEDDEQLCNCFADYYKATQDLSKYVEELTD
ncbi:MAG: hypothetical protein U9P36_11350 [Thermodesulfobacteriota bacterium]|nr:hypothetical protein [Thermodesulfobacteriota bacterium]